MSDMEPPEGDRHDDTHNEAVEVSPSIIIEHVNLAADIDRRAALVTVKIGEVRVHGVEVWRSRYGRLSVRFPVYRAGSVWAEAFEVSDDRRTEIEIEVLAAFREAKKQQAAEETARENAKRQEEVTDANDH
jgi:hypothetical protein